MHSCKIYGCSDRKQQRKQAAAKETREYRQNKYIHDISQKEKWNLDVPKFQQPQKG